MNDRLTAFRLVSSLLIFLSIFVSGLAIFIYVFRQIEIRKLNGIFETTEPVPQLPGLTVCFLIILSLILFLVGFGMRNHD